MRIIDRSIVAIDAPMATMKTWIIFADAWIFFTQASIARIQARYFKIEG
ncbi:MAG: hypothetical protein V5B30_14380 [Candidatus Accumulibacter delftensis]|jgi:hypothetical protein